MVLIVDRTVQIQPGSNSDQNVSRTQLAGFRCAFVSVRTNHLPHFDDNLISGSCKVCKRARGFSSIVCRVSREVTFIM